MIIMNRDRYLQMTDNIVQAAEQLDELNEIDYIELPVLWEILGKYIQPSHSSGQTYVERVKRIIAADYPPDDMKVETQKIVQSTEKGERTVATIIVDENCPPYVKKAICQMLELLAENEKKVQTATKVAENAIVKPWKPE